MPGGENGWSKSKLECQGHAGGGAEARSETLNTKIRAAEAGLST